MNEHLTRGVQPPKSQPVPYGEGIPPKSVDEALALAMSTHQSNSLVAVIKRYDSKAQKDVYSYFVVRAGRGGKLNEAAQKKNGIALMRPVCVRASWETPEQILKLYEALPTTELKTKFLESRGCDWRAFTAPKGWAIYLFTILFGSGEKWQGEGIANPENIDKKEWQDSIAETRAFSRTVGRGTGEGLLPGDQLAGSGEMDDEMDEAEALTEAQVAARLAGQAVTKKVSTPIEHPSKSEEAAPDGDDPFRTSEHGGQGGTGADAGTPAGAGPAPATESGAGGTGEGKPLPTSSQPSHQQDGGNRGPDAGKPVDAPDITVLIALATATNVRLKDLAKEHFDTDNLRGLTDFQRTILKDKLDEIHAAATAK